MIIIDNALAGAGGRGPAHRGRDRGRRVHGPRPDQPDHQQRARDAGQRRREPDAREGGSRASRGGRRRCSSGRGRPRASIAAVAAGAVAITQDFRAATGASTVDAVVEATGAVEYGCHVVVEAIAARKDIVLMNAEVDGTVGPILSKRAKAGGVILTGCDGDQPGVQMNLVRFVRGLGLRASGVRKHQGPAGRVPHPDDPGRIRRQVGSGPVHGDELRRWHQGVFRAGDRRERDRDDRRASWNARARITRATSTS